MKLEISFSFYKKIGLAVIFQAHLLMPAFSQMEKAPEELRIAIVAGQSQAPALREILMRFQKETGIAVKTYIADDGDYRVSMNKWLIEKKDTPDVMYWFASQSLFEYAEKGVISPITDIWNKEGYDRNFMKVKSVVSYKGEVWGLPLSYYHWGFYYKKSLVSKYGAPPKTWSAFLTMAAKMKADGISPFALGNEELWPALAWFDYLNLRINGVDFHRKIMNGKISFADRRIMVVFEELSKIIKLEYFDPNLLKNNTRDIVPLIRREKVGFTLMGNFIASRIPVDIADEFGFMKFPVFKSGPYYENAPLDVFIVPKKIKNKKNTEAFLKFMARADIQSAHNAKIGYLPPNKHSTVSDGLFLQQGAALLNETEEVVQYFDRDTTLAFSNRALPIWNEFMHSGDVRYVSKELEKVRRLVFFNRSR